MSSSVRVILLTCIICLQMRAAYAFFPKGLQGILVENIATKQPTDMSAIWSEDTNKLIVFGTYAADFNAIEYCQRLKYYLPILRKKESVDKVCLVLNATPESCKCLLEYVGLQDENIEVYADELGTAGKAFGCGVGWRPEDSEMSPYLKLFGMLFGLGAWATLPSVIGGYIGNPFSPQPWIEDALVVGTKQGRFPTNAVELDEAGMLKENKFKSLPQVGSWGRRPLELATLRLQNMMGISLANWEKLKPTKRGLEAGVLTQLGGMAVVGADGEAKYEWRDAGICHVANFEEVLKSIV